MDLLGSIDTITTNTDTLLTNIQNLQAQVTQLQQQNSSLQSALDTANATITTLTNEKLSTIASLGTIITKQNEILSLFTN